MKKLNYAIVFVSDMSQGVAFYRDVLGLPLKFESPHWSEFANDGSTIALHPAEPEGTSGSPRAESRGSARNAAGTAQLGFHVEDLDAWHTKLTAAGVRCVQQPRAEAYGIRQAVYADPDGLRFTIAQSLSK